MNRTTTNNKNNELFFEKDQHNSNVNFYDILQHNNFTCFFLFEHKNLRNCDKMKYCDAMQCQHDDSAFLFYGLLDSPIDSEL